jgi:hypothetical protein
MALSTIDQRKDLFHLTFKSANNTLRHRVRPNNRLHKYLSFHAWNEKETSSGIRMGQVMRPNPLQYMFAYNIPGKLCYVGFPIAVLVWSFVVSGVRLENLNDLTVIGLGLLISVISVPLGFLLGVLFISSCLSPFYYAMEEMNGGPFRPGERVYVIAGRHKGQIKRVSSRGQGFSVILRIGDEENETSESSYWSLGLIGMEQAEPECRSYTEKLRGSERR